MATSQRGDQPGTTVARQEKRAEAVERMTPEQRRELQRIRAENALTMTIMQESWGTSLSLNQQRAFAEFIRKFHLDVSEVDNLGGRPYRNGYYYRRRIQEMRSKGAVEWSAGEHIGPNADLEAMAKDESVSPEYRAKAREECDRRRWERARWDVPADATHAYICRVKLKGDANPLEGCDFITPARLNKYGKIADPIGAADPEKTVITRAWRRVGLLVAAEIPELKADETAMDVGAAEIVEETEATIEADTQRAAAIDARHPRQMIAGASEPGGYDRQANAEPQPREVTTTRVAPPVTDAHRALADQGAGQPDPYDDGAKGSGADSRQESQRGTSGGSIGGGARAAGQGHAAPSSTEPASSLATRAQKERITELLSTPGLDLADAEIARIAKVAGAPSYPARDAVREIARLEALLPGGEGLFGGDEGGA